MREQFSTDELLTLSSDKDCSSLVKMLVAAISSCNHAQEVAREWLGGTDGRMYELIDEEIFKN